MFASLVADDFLRSEYDVSRCSYRLFASTIFAAHADYVRRQIIYGLLQVERVHARAAELALTCSVLFRKTTRIPFM